jgi:hypothetical protein
MLIAQKDFISATLPQSQGLIYEKQEKTSIVSWSKKIYSPKKSSDPEGGFGCGGTEEID